MSSGTWLKLVRNSTLAATLVTAAQVGIGSGVGIIDWQPGLASPDGWRALLTWVVFMFAVGTLAGAAVGQRFVPVRLRPLRPFPRLTAAAGAAFGALLAFPVVWLPVAVAHTGVSPRPELTVAIAAGVGVLLGLVVALLALAWGAVTAGAALTVGWVWLLALSSALLSALNHAAVTPGLGLLDAPAALPPSTWWSGPFLMVGLSAVFGLFVAAVAGWRGSPWPGVALSGVVGPTLIAAAYLTTGSGLALAGLTASSGATAPVIAALVAAMVGLTVSAAVAAPQQRRHRLETFGSTRRPVAALPPVPAVEPRRPLAITSSAEQPYEMEASQPIYLAPTRSASSPVTVYSADPYSSDAFEVSSRAFDTVSVPRRSSSRKGSSSSPLPTASSPSPASPSPGSPSRPVPTGPAVPPSPARRAGFPAASPPAPVQPVSAFPGGANLDVPSGLFSPVTPPPVPPAPTRPAYVEPSRLVEQGYAQPAGPSEPGFDERVYRMPAPGSSGTPKPLSTGKKPKGKGRSTSAAVASLPLLPLAPVRLRPRPRLWGCRGRVPGAAVRCAAADSTRRSPAAPARSAPTPSAPPAAARASVPVASDSSGPAGGTVPLASPTAEPTLRVPPTTPPSRSPVADPAPTARPAPAAGPVPTQPTGRRGRKAARAADKPAPEPVSSLRAGSIEGEVLAESTSPTSGGPAGRRGRKDKDRPLRKGEREHIDWVTNLVQIEHDSVLKTSKER